MGNSIEAAVNEVLKEYETIVLEATKEAAHKGQEDAIKKAKKCLQEYYRWKPKMYKRTKSLRRAIFPYWGDKSNQSMASITIGVRYNASALQGVYKSNSKWHQTGSVWKPVPASLKIGMTKGAEFTGAQKDFFGAFGRPEPNYILENYLEGIHGEAHIDAQGTTEKMNKYFDDELPNRIIEYMETALFDAVVKRL